MADSDRLLVLARQALEGLPADRPGIVEPAELLGQLLLQDIKRQSGNGDADDDVSLEDGVSRDRMLSVHAPEMRHVHKSSSRRFNGHKAAVVVDTCQGRRQNIPVGRSKSVPPERSLASVNVRASCSGEVSQRQAGNRLGG